jgi:hypothetical protein
MLKVLKVTFTEGNQTLDVPEGIKVVASLYGGIDGVVLLVEAPTPEPVQVEEGVSSV